MKGADNARVAPRFRAAVIGYDEPFNPPAWFAGELARAGIETQICNCASPADVLAVAAGRDVLLTSSARRLLSAEVIAGLAGCRGLVRIGSGVDCIDLLAASERGIPVINTPQALAEEVADHTVALMLACVRHLGPLDRSVRAGAWRGKALPTARRMRGKTLGLVGFGRIGRAVTRKLMGFELRCLVYDPYVSAEEAAASGVQVTDLDTVLREADLLSLHIPLAPDTHRLIGARELALMKPTAILVNTARGGVVDQQALFRALADGKLAAAGLDVLEQEPPAPDDPLLKLDNVLFTPHIAASSDEVMDALYSEGCRVTIELCRGQLPATVVNRAVQVWWQRREE